MELKTLNEVEIETKRFLKRVDACKKKIIEDGFEFSIGNCLENGAVKRAALDLKNELTRITNPK